MRSIYLAAGAAGILSLLAACGGDDKPGALPDGSKAGSSSGGRRSTGGSKADAGEGGEGSGTAGTFNVGGGKGGTAGGSSLGQGGEGGSENPTPNDPLAPNIIITSPKEGDDPNQEGGVIVAANASITCVVTESSLPGASMVNESSVKLAVLDSSGKTVVETVGVPTDNSHEFAGTLSLTNVPAGVISFVCRAEDIAKHAGSDQVSSLLDKGPTITFVKPELMSAHALTQPLDVEFTVNEARLTDTDAHASVEAVSLDVAGVDIDLTNAQDTPGHYRLQVNLKDPKFNPVPNGTIPVTVKASNDRRPTAVVAVDTRPTNIDGAGPTIGITGPLDKDVVGGTVRLLFSVSDAISGVDPDTVVVSLNDVEHPYDAASDRWTRSGNNFTFEFDSRQVKNSKVQITVNIGASDLVGNISPVSSELLYLDNYPPVLDLDPMNIRTKTRSTPRTCSVSFDPVGDGARNDLDRAAVAGTFRAVVWDQTNTDPEIPQSHFSKTNPSSVRLYLEGDNAKALLIDKDKDGICDEVAKVDSSNSIELDPIPRSGDSWYSTNASDAAPDAASLECVTRTTTPFPEKLCSSHVSDMWQVIEDDYNGIPVIYGVAVTPGAECTGVSWEFTGKLSQDGWVCFATRAVDNAGNVGISRPLRLCVDNPSIAGTPACANSSVLPPSCTDGCTAPARWGNFAVNVP